MIHCIISKNNVKLFFYSVDIQRLGFARQGSSDEGLCGHYIL